MNAVEDAPLVVDLDGTLIRSDLLVETFLAFLRQHPLRLPDVLRWWRCGRPALKEALALASEIDVALLPYDSAVLDLIKQHRGKRHIVLATGSHLHLAKRVAAHLGLFDEVIATEGELNLAGKAKRNALVLRYGEGCFDYAGNSHDDLSVWSAARHGFVVNATPGVVAKARALGNLANVIPLDGGQLRHWAKALRLHQWLKNLLLFVPLVAAHRLGETRLLLDGLAAFLAFGCCASSVYLLNDLLDLQDDRRHPRKKVRPFASGQLPLHVGLLAVPLLLAIGLGLGFVLLPPGFTSGLAGYYALTVAYSLWLKRRAAIDVVALAGFYTLRMVLGAVAMAIPLSNWLLVFSMFIFLSLALAKRCAELSLVRARDPNGKAHGRGYTAGDLPRLSTLGIASGCVSVLVLAVYIKDTHAMSLYRHPEILWWACPLLLAWLTRVWLLVYRGDMHEDPIVFALQDKASVSLGALLGLVLWAAM